MIDSTLQVHEKGFGIAFGISYSKNTPFSLIELWVSIDGKSWKPGSLHSGKRHPERLAALFAAAELARSRGPARAFLTNCDSPTLFNFARKLIRSEPSYLANLSCFHDLFGEKQHLPRLNKHPFFAKWFTATTTDVRLNPPYANGNVGSILFYKIANDSSLDAMTSCIGTNALKRITSVDALRSIMVTFSKGTRPPSGAAIRGRPQKRTNVIPKLVLPATTPSIMDEYVSRLKSMLSAGVSFDSNGMLDIDRALPMQLCHHEKLASREVNRFIAPDNLFSLPHSRLIVISGYAGEGKTTILRRLAWNLCQAHGSLPNPPVPIFISLSHYTGNLISAIATEVYPNKNISEKDEQAKILLRSHKCVVLLDALDDVRGDDAPMILKQIPELLSYNTTLQVILTTRPIALPFLKDVELFHVMPLSPAECLCAYGIPLATALSTIKTLTANGYPLTEGFQLPDSNRAESILNTPLFLWMLALILNNTHPQTNPLTLGLFMNEVIPRHFLIREGLKRHRQETASDITDADILSCLEILAVHMLDSCNTCGISRVDALKAFTKHFRHHETASAGTLASSMLTAATYSGFLITSDNDIVKFRHDTFRDFFAARHVDTQLQIGKDAEWIHNLVLRNAWDGAIVTVCEFTDECYQRDFIEAALSCDVDYAIIIANHAPLSTMRDTISLRVTTECMTLLLDRGGHYLQGGCLLGHYPSPYSTSLVMATFAVEVDRVLATPPQKSKLRTTSLHEIGCCLITLEMVPTILTDATVAQSLKSRYGKEPTLISLLKEVDEKATGCYPEIFTIMMTKYSTAISSSSRFDVFGWPKDGNGNALNDRRFRDHSETFTKDTSLHLSHAIESCDKQLTFLRDNCRDRDWLPSDIVWPSNWFRGITIKSTGDLYFCMNDWGTAIALTMNKIPIEAAEELLSGCISAFRSIGTIYAKYAAITMMLAVKKTSVRRFPSSIPNVLFSDWHV